MILEHRFQKLDIIDIKNQYATVPNTVLSKNAVIKRLSTEYECDPLLIEKVIREHFDMETLSKRGVMVSVDTDMEDNANVSKAKPEVQFKTHTINLMPINHANTVAKQQPIKTAINKAIEAGIPKAQPVKNIKDIEKKTITETSVDTLHTVEDKDLSMNKIKTTQTEKTIPAQETAKTPGNKPKTERVGEVRTMNNGMEVTIIAYRSSRDMDVKFANGIIREHVEYRQFCDGQITDKLPGRQPTTPATERINETRTMTNGKEATIIVYRNSKDIDVKFSNGVIREHMEYKQFRRGQISDTPRVRRKTIEPPAEPAVLEKTTAVPNDVTVIIKQEGKVENNTDKMAEAKTEEPMTEKKTQTAQIKTTVQAAIQAEKTENKEIENTQLAENKAKIPQVQDNPAAVIKGCFTNMVNLDETEKAYCYALCQGAVEKASAEVKELMEKLDIAIKKQKDMISLRDKFLPASSEDVKQPESK